MSQSNNGYVQTKFCTCAETLLCQPDGKEYRVPKPQYHNCDYIRARNELLPIAVMHADEICGLNQRGNTVWANCFAYKMEQLAQENLLYDFN